MAECVDKAVIVTGASNGIGRAIALQCISMGFYVIACDQDQKGLDSLGDEVSTQSIMTIQLDVSDYQQVESCFDQAAEHIESRKIYGLVNNAGIYLGRSFLTYSPKEIDRIIDVNIKGAIYFSKYFALKAMQASQEGVIVNIASVSGQEGSSDAIYGASKAAIIGLTKSCAMNFAPSIRVNAVAPTLVNTNMIKLVPQERVTEYRNRELLGDPVQPEDVAETVLFLLSEKSRHYTGAVFDLNNGVYLR